MLFLSTPSARRATGCVLAVAADLSDFYPRPPRGGRRITDMNTATALVFLSTPSARRATHSSILDDHNEPISIHALREEGDRSSSAQTSATRISIHALREEGDAGTWERWQITSISIHALREEGDRPSSRRPTPSTYFYPRPPRGGRPKELEKHTYIKTNFYPRPPRGGRPKEQVIGDVSFEFLSTPSARRATTRTCRKTPGRSDFYPRPPRGGRLAAETGESDDLVFLSTPSARRATPICWKC